MVKVAQTPYYRSINNAYVISVFEKGWFVDDSCICDTVSGARLYVSYRTIHGMDCPSCRKCRRMGRLGYWVLVEERFRKSGVARAIAWPRLILTLLIKC